MNSKNIPKYFFRLEESMLTAMKEPIKAPNTPPNIIHLTNLNSIFFFFEMNN